MQVEAEVIACILREPSKLMACDLKPEDFISTQCGEIYSAMLDMQREKVAIDPFSVSERLESMTGQSWMQTVLKIENETYGRAPFQNQVEKVRRDGQIKNITNMVSLFVEEVQRNKDLTLADNLIQELMEVRKTKTNHSHSLKESVSKALDSLEKLHDQEGLPGLETGLAKLDAAIGGFRDTNLIVIGARPAMGKTAFLINCALAGAKLGRVGIISAEQDDEQLAQRMMSILGNIDSQKIRTGKLEEEDWPKLTAVVVRLKELGIEINDKPGIDINSIRRQARDWKFKYDIKALYIDYLQKVKPARHHNSRKSEVAEIAGALKDLARELKIPVVALAQVSRKCEDRPDKRPMMSDLADAAEIEMEADEIITLYRDEVYNENTNEKGIAELLVCKARHGRTGMVKVQWEGQYMQFNDLEQRYSDQSHYNKEKRA